MSEREHYIFEDPHCRLPDHSHPNDHAAKNIGAALVGWSMGVRESNPGVTPAQALGAAAMALLWAARQDPSWANAILDCIAEANIPGVTECADNLLEAFPLSPLDKAMAEGAKS